MTNSWQNRTEQRWECKGFPGVGYLVFRLPSLGQTKADPWASVSQAEGSGEQNQPSEWPQYNSQTNLSTVPCTPPLPFLLDGGSCKHWRDTRARKRQDRGNTIPCISVAFNQTCMCRRYWLFSNLCLAVELFKACSSLTLWVTHSGLQSLILMQPRILVLGKAEPTKCRPDYLMLCPVLGRWITGINSCLRIHRWDLSAGRSNEMAFPHQHLLPKQGQ